jgi:hypothetical protein
VLWLLKTEADNYTCDIDSFRHQQPRGLQVPQQQHLHVSSSYVRLCMRRRRELGVQS